jgi:hypothetical protein
MSRRELACLSVLTAILLVHAWHLNVVAEDAFITFRFARHLADGHGLVWNVGERPVEGYTSFLWLLLCALALELGLDVVPLSQLLGVAASLVTMLYTHRFARRALDIPPGHALIPCAFLAASGPFAAWAAGGMETNLFGTFLLLACTHLAGWARLDSRRDLAICFSMLLLATLTRPEGFLVFALIAALAAVISRSQTRAGFRSYALALMVYLIPFLTYFVWRAEYFGFPLPNTFYAKTGGGFHQYVRGAGYSALFAFHFLLPLAPILAAAAWEGDWRGGARAGMPGRSFAAHLKAQVGSHVCGLIVVAYTASIVYVGGDYMAMYRFFVPILPLIYLPVGLVAHRLFARIAGSRHKRSLAAGLVAAGLLLTGLQSTPLERRLFARPWFMHGTYRGIQVERWHVARYTVIGRLFRDRNRSGDASIALLSVGAIPYYSGMRTHSMHGIVDAHIAHKRVPRNLLGRGFPGHEKRDVAHALSKEPTWVLFTNQLYPQREAHPDYYSQGIRPDELSPFLERYRLTWVWLSDPGNREAGYFPFLELVARDPRGERKEGPR